MFARGLARQKAGAGIVRAIPWDHSLVSDRVTWLTESPPETIMVGDINLTRALLSDAAKLIEAVNASLPHLQPWMPWAQEPAATESIGAFLREAVSDWKTGQAFQFAIRDTLKPVSCIPSGSKMRSRRNSSNGLAAARSSSTPSTCATVLYIHCSPG